MKDTELFTISTFITTSQSARVKEIVQRCIDEEVHNYLALGRMVGHHNIICTYLVREDRFAVTNVPACLNAFVRGVLAGTVSAIYGFEAPKILVETQH